MDHEKILSKVISFINNQRMSLFIILVQGAILGAWMQYVLSQHFLDPFFSARLIVTLELSIVVLGSVWIISTMVLRKLLSCSLDWRTILTLDAHTYWIFLLSVFGGMVVLKGDISVKSFWVIFVIGFLGCIGLKEIIIRRRLPDETNVAGDCKARILNHTSDLNADECISKEIRIGAKLKLRKHLICNELRNAIDLKGMTQGTLEINGSFIDEQLSYAIGWSGAQGNIEGNLKLYFKQGDKRQLILDKDARHLLEGWNVFHVPLKNKENPVEFYWENSVLEHIYLAPPHLCAVPRKKKKQNIIVVILDGLIPETIGLYREDSQADHISRYFKNGFVFSNAYVQGEWTLPNLASIVTSLYSQHHGVCDPDLYSRELSQGNQTLAEILQENGFHTFAYISGSRASQGYGHARGYHQFNYRPTRAFPRDNHQQMTWKALKFLEENPQTSNFLFLHYYDIHDPYFPVAENGSSLHDAMFNGSVEDIIKKERLRPEEIQFLRELYWQKYREIDASLSRLFDYISRYENPWTSVILTSDHGTNLFEDDLVSMLPAGKRSDARSLTDSILKVPFLISGNLQGRSCSFHNPLEANVTIYPTILDMVNIPIPKSINGISAFTSDKGVKTKDYVIAESNFKDRYELYVNAREWCCWLTCQRDRNTGKRISPIRQKIFMDKSGAIITDSHKLGTFNKKVKSILDENHLQDVMWEEI